jgi:hypothetical protein
MSTLGVTLGALGSGIIPEGSGALLSIGPVGPDLVAGLAALVVGVLGILVVRHFQSADDAPATPAAAPAPGGHEIRKAA